MTKKNEMQLVGAGRFRPAPGMLASPSYHGPSSSFVHQTTGQFIFPYPTYG